MKVYVLHHNDLDGYVSADIVKTKYPDAVCLECSYDKKTKIDKSMFQFGDIVFIVDYSLDVEDMKWFNMHTNLIWIDHHVSAINKSKENGYDDIEGIREIGLGGCELTWRYIYPDIIENMFVRLCGQFDTFRTSDNRDYFHEKVLTFFYGTQVNIDKLNPKNFGTEKFLFNTLNDYIQFGSSIVCQFQNIGKNIYDYNKVEYQKACESSSYVRNIWGARVLCINTSEKGSLVFDIPKCFNPELHDMMCSYNYNGERWCYGFYAPNGQTKVDCSKIAMQYGGGGHVCASGCTTEKLIEELL